MLKAAVYVLSTILQNLYLIHNNWLYKFAHLSTSLFDISVKDIDDESICFLMHSSYKTQGVHGEVYTAH